MSLDQDKGIFTNIWGNKFALFGFIVILLFVLGMLMVPMCNPKYVEHQEIEPIIKSTK